MSSADADRITSRPRRLSYIVEEQVIVGDGGTLLQRGSQ